MGGSAVFYIESFIVKGDSAMANREHVKILQQGINIWNDWRKQYPKTRPDLTGGLFGGVNFRSINLCSSNLRNVDLSGADLSRADLSEANLSDADLDIEAQRRGTSGVKNISI